MFGTGVSRLSTQEESELLLFFSVVLQCLFFKGSYMAHIYRGLMVEGFLNMYWCCCLRKPHRVYVSFWKVCLSFLKTQHLKFCLDMKQQPCHSDGIVGYGPQKNSDWGSCRDADPFGVDTAATPQQSPQVVGVGASAGAALW